MTVFVGTAGWGLSREQQALFGPGGSVLERYATRLSAAEINSSFYRPHRRSTYQKWAASVPEDFRFSVKVPKAITHTAKLRECAGLLADFMEGVNGLGDKLGGLLVQLPPSLKYEPDVAADFFAALRQETPVPAVCEPRHATWFGGEADALLRQFQGGWPPTPPAYRKLPYRAVLQGPSTTAGTVRRACITPPIRRRSWRRWLRRCGHIPARSGSSSTTRRAGPGWKMPSGCGNG